MKPASEVARELAPDIAMQVVQAVRNGKDVTGMIAPLLAQAILTARREVREAAAQLAAPKHKSGMWFIPVTLADDIRALDIGET